MHNRQSAPSHTGVATNGQLLIIVLLNTQFSQPGTDCSAGAIIMVKNKAKKCYVSQRKRDRGMEREGERDNQAWCVSARHDGTEEGKRKEEKGQRKRSKNAKMETKRKVQDCQSHAERKDERETERR